MKAKRIVTQSTINPQAPALDYAQQLANFNAICAAAENGEPRAFKALTDLSRAASRPPVLKAASAFRERRQRVDVEAGTQALVKLGYTPTSRQLQSLFSLSDGAREGETVDGAFTCFTSNRMAVAGAPPDEYVGDPTKKGWIGYFNDCILGLDTLSDKAGTGSEAAVCRLFMAARYISCLVNQPEGEEARRMVDAIIYRHQEEGHKASGL